MYNADWRPTRLREYIGQKALINQLEVEIKAATRQKRPIHHMVLSGPEGTGKSTIANVLAAELNCPEPVEVMGKALNHHLLTRTLVGLKSSGYGRYGHLEHPEQATYPFLVINESQKTPREMLNLLHPVLEPGTDGRRIFMARLDNGNIEPLWCVHFCCILITNYLGDLACLSAPTLSRFPINYEFEWYNDAEISQIIRQYAAKTQNTIMDNAVELLAQRSNGMPRHAIQLFRRAIDFHSVGAINGAISQADVNAMLDTVGIDENGMDKSMVKYLQALAKSPAGKLSLSTLSAILSTNEQTIFTCIEPLLLKRGLVIRAPNGREITPEGRALVSGDSRDSFYSRRVT